MNLHESLTETRLIKVFGVLVSTLGLLMALASCTNGNTTEQESSAGELSSPSNARRDDKTTSLPKVPRSSEGAPSSNSVDKIDIQSRSSAPGIYGTYANGSVSIEFASTLDRQFNRTVSFQGSDGRELMKATFNDSTGAASYRVANIEWDGTNSLSADQRADVTMALMRDTSLPDVAAYIFWKAPRIEQAPFRLSIIQLYAELAEFYPPERKTFRQPPGTTSGSCWLDACQLRTGEAVFGCPSSVAGEQRDVTILVNGLPEGCNVRDT